MMTHISNEQLYEFSKYVNAHPAYKHIKTMVEQDLFNQFVVGNEQIRLEVASVMQGLLLWESQLNKIINSHVTDKDINN